MPTLLMQREIAQWSEIAQWTKVAKAIGLELA
jgi:hypothetical protein